MYYGLGAMMQHLNLFVSINNSRTNLKHFENAMLLCCNLIKEQGEQQGDEMETDD